MRRRRITPNDNIIIQGPLVLSLYFPTLKSTGLASVRVFSYTCTFLATMYYLCIMHNFLLDLRLRMSIYEHIV